jgi:hypothetical protein
LLLSWTLLQHLAGPSCGHTFPLPGYSRRDSRDVGEVPERNIVPRLHNQEWMMDYYVSMLLEWLLVKQIVPRT